jgi:outer membrane murein-binding lipoprotein Lpp
MARSLRGILFSVVLAATVLSGCASMDGPERQPLTLEALVGLAKEGKDAATMIQTIKTSETIFDVTASQYAKLSRDGVPDAVIDFMQQGQLKMAERQGRREAMQDAWFYGRGYWGHGYSSWAPRPYGVWVSGRYHKRSY